MFQSHSKNVRTYSFKRHDQEAKSTSHKILTFLKSVLLIYKMFCLYKSKNILRKMAFSAFKHYKWHTTILCAPPAKPAWLYEEDLMTENCKYLTQWPNPGAPVSIASKVQLSVKKVISHMKNKKALVSELVTIHHCNVCQWSYASVVEVQPHCLRVWVAIHKDSHWNKYVCL